MMIVAGMKNLIFGMIIFRRKVVHPLFLSVHAREYVCQGHSLNFEPRDGAEMVQSSYIRNPMKKSFTNIWKKPVFIALQLRRFN